MFEAVFGHERIKTLLARMVEKDQVHHGLCFHGPSGIGKRLLARQLAKVMLCEQQTGCDECKHCHKFSSGNHPDFLEVEPEGASDLILVDRVRDIAENLHYRPFEARARVIILDRVERMNESAANAFLKSLEEPPEYVYFVLVTADLKALLPTIRSRCQKIGFQSLTDDDKAKVLMHRFRKEEGMAHRLAAISFRQLETDEEAWDEFVKDIKRVLTFFKHMLDEGQGLDMLNDLLGDKQKLPRFLDHMTAATRELTLLARGLPGSTPFTDFREEMADLAKKATPTAWRQVWQELVELNGQRRLNLNARLWFNALSVTGLGLLAREETQLKRRLAARG